MSDNETILLAHGGGGQLTAELIAQVILPAVGGQQPGALRDAATLPAQSGPLAFTTDSYVVWPLEFPGGDIGKLAVCGTINDLAVSGARPVALSLGLVLEEGLPIEVLRRVLTSAGQAAREAGVIIATGDTKVVERGKCDGLYINTAGIGAMLPQAQLGYDRLAEGDAVILSGSLGDHGLTIMSRRKGLSFASELRTDCAALHQLCAALVEELGARVKFMRDLTRGGLAATLAEISSSARVDIEIQESAIPVNRSVRAAAEMLGLDVLTVANEGKLAAIVSADAADEAVRILRSFPLSRQAVNIGRIVKAQDEPLVEMVTQYGGRRIVQMPYGEELPRIC